MTQAGNSEHSSDERLLVTLGRGDAEALGILWDRHSRPVYSLALRVLRDPGWAEEVVQDVFLRLWSSPRAYDPTRGDLRRWLLTVCHHAAIDGLRSKRGAARNRDAGPGRLEIIPHHGGDPADTVLLRLEAEHLRAAMENLPGNQRELMELVYFEGYTQAEAAQQTGQPLGTVKSRLRLGMQRLRVLLEGTE